MKTYKRYLVPVLSLLLVFSMATVIFATEVSFTRARVDSNEWTYITSAKKEQLTYSADVKVNVLYKQDGSASSYKHLYARATAGGPIKPITTGKYYALEIPQSYQMAGSYVSLYLMGFDPALDCQASGYWVVH